MSLSTLVPILVFASIALAVLLAPIVRWMAVSCGVLDRPTGGRKIHQKATPLWGGLVTGGVIIIGLFTILPFADGKELRVEQIIGFVLALVTLIIGGMLDDRFGLKPAVQFLFPLAASVIVVASGSGIELITNPLGGSPISLEWWKSGGALDFSLPGDAITILWLLTVTYAMKFLDGLDGLVSGMTVIGAVLIAGLASSPAYFQPLIACIALIVAGAHLGFLPYNREGSLFLGEAGSTIAGFSLAVLAVISGAKLATAATALAVPLVDIVLVVVGRLIAGTSPFKGDASHLHFRLLRAGLAPWTAVRLIWGLALIFGLVALTLQTRGKLFLFTGLIVLICVISLFAWNKRRETKV